MLTNEEPLVSVIMATYNEPVDIIGKAVKSILNQTFQDFELLILDDSTNQESISYIDSLNIYPKVKVIRKPERMGLSGARNVGIQSARGKYIAIMDADDISVPERFELQVNYLEAHSDCYVLGGQINIIDEKDRVISQRHYPLKGIRLRLFASYRNPLAHPTVMFRKELCDKGFIYDETLEMSEDLDLWLRIMNADFKIENLESTLINYRVNESFTNKRSSQKQKNYMADVRNKNWASNHLIFSVASSIAGILFRIIPSESLKLFYNKENRKGKR